MINEKKNFDCELVEWPLICRDLYQHRWMGGPDANTDRLKQSISAVRASGGFPGNVFIDTGARSRRWPLCPRSLYIASHRLPYVLDPPPPRPDTGLPDPSGYTFQSATYFASTPRPSPTLVPSFTASHIAPLPSILHPPDQCIGPVLLAHSACCIPLPSSNPYPPLPNRDNPTYTGRLVV